MASKRLNVDSNASTNPPEAPIANQSSLSLKEETDTWHGRVNKTKSLLFHVKGYYGGRRNEYVQNVNYNFSVPLGRHRFLKTKAISLG